MKSKIYMGIVLMVFSYAVYHVSTLLTFEESGIKLDFGGNAVVREFSKPTTALCYYTYETSGTCLPKTKFAYRFPDELHAIGRRAYINPNVTKIGPAFRGTTTLTPSTFQYERYFAGMPQGNCLILKKDFNKEVLWIKCGNRTLLRPENEADVKDLSMWTEPYIKKQ